MCNLLFRILIEGIKFVIKGNPTILCFKSIILSVCWNGLFKSFFVPFFDEGSIFR